MATQLANSMINRGGPALVVRIADQTDAPPDRIAAAFATVRDGFGLTALNTAIEELDNRVAASVQLGIFAAVQNLLLDRIVWFLRNVDLTGGLDGIVEHYRAGIAIVADRLNEVIDADAQARVGAAALKLMSEGVPEVLARTIASLPALGSAADIVLIADRTATPVAAAASIYFAAVAYFQIDRVAAAAGEINLVDYFDRLAFDRALETIGDAMQRISAEIAGTPVDTAGASGSDAAAAVHAWVERKGATVTRAREAVHEIAASGLTLSKLTVAASMLGDLARPR